MIKLKNNKMNSLSQSFQLHENIFFSTLNDAILFAISLLGHFFYERYGQLNIHILPSLAVVVVSLVKAGLRRR